MFIRVSVFAGMCVRKPSCLYLIKVRCVFVFDTLSISRAYKAPNGPTCRTTQQNTHTNTQDMSICLTRMRVRAKAITSSQKNLRSHISSPLRWSLLTAVNTYLMLSLWTATEPWNKASISKQDVCYRICPAAPPARVASLRGFRATPGGGSFCWATLY